MRNSGLNYYNLFDLFNCLYHLSSRCVMALIRGINSHYPCPVCLVPAEDLSDLSKIYPLRTTEKMKEVYETAQGAETMAAKEVILKEYSLRDVEVHLSSELHESEHLKSFIWFLIGCVKSHRMFSKLSNTDVYAAISWDCLHAYHGGLFSDHLWVCFKEIVMALGRSFCEKFDTQ